MSVSRRGLFKGLAGLATAAGLVVITPKLTLPNDPEYEAWVRGDRKKFWPGVEPLEAKAEEYNHLSPDMRTYLLSLTELGRLVLYREMLGIPPGMLPAEMIDEARHYHVDVETPDAEQLRGRSTVYPRNYFYTSTDGRHARVDMEQWHLDHPRKVQQLDAPDLWIPKSASAMN